MTGKMEPGWRAAQGWICVSVEDLRAPNAVCEMCETREIRYVHHMKHTTYGEVLGVGCVCAGNMENDYEGPRRREQVLRNEEQRRRHWLSRKWKISAKGNAYLNTDGLNITVFQKNIETVGEPRIEDRTTDQSVPSKRKYKTEDEAKLAAFDKMIFLKKERGWGS